MYKDKHYVNVRKQNFNYNEPFYMVSFSFPQIIYKIMNEYPKAILVLAVLIDCSNDYGATIISQRVISNNIKGISPKTVSKAVNYLCTNEYIKVMHVKGKSVYMINSNIFWHTSRTTQREISNYMGFSKPKQLTERNNAAYPYFLRHLRMIQSSKPKEKDEDFKNITNIMKTYHHDRKNPEFVKSKSLKQAKREIISCFNKIRFTNKEGKVAQYVVHKLLNNMSNSTKSDPPILPYSNKTLRSKVISDESQYTQGLKSVSYAVVARAMYKLHRYRIISRKRIHNGSHYSDKDGYITLNPEWMPLKKDKISKKQLRHERKVTRIYKSFNRLVWKRYRALTRYKHKIRLNDINEYFRLNGALHAFNINSSAKSWNLDPKLNDKVDEVNKFIKQVKIIHSRDKKINSNVKEQEIENLRANKPIPDFYKNIAEPIKNICNSKKILDICCSIYKTYKNMSEDEKNKYKNKSGSSYDTMMKSLFK